LVSTIAITVPQATINSIQASGIAQRGIMYGPQYGLASKQAIFFNVFQACPLYTVPLLGRFVPFHSVPWFPFFM